MATERERQKRLERKRRRRRQKQLRREQREAPPTVSLESGRPKMSETLVAFAEPLLGDGPKTELQWQTALYVAALVWNSVVVGMPSGEMVEKLQSCLDRSADVGKLVSVLTERKRKLFPDDLRLILDVRAQQSGDRVLVTAVGTLVR